MVIGPDIRTALTAAKKQDPSTEVTAVRQPQGSYLFDITTKDGTRKRATGVHAWKAAQILCKIGKLIPPEEGVVAIMGERRHMCIFEELFDRRRKGG